MTQAVKRKMKLSADDRLFYMLVNTVIFLFVVAVAYPIIYVISASFSSGQAVSTGRVFLWPVDLSIDGYKAVFSHRDIMSGYRNTIFYTVAGTLLNVGMTLICAYPLSRKEMPFRGFFMFLFTFTMFFSGGLIPSYMLIKSLNMINTVWVMIIPGAISTFNMILTRTYLQNSIPIELLEASKIDGCSDARYFFHVILPLSKAIIAVITLYYAVGHWNSYFSAMIYLNDKRLYPLQLILRNVLLGAQINLSDLDDPELLAGKVGLADQLKYSLIIVSSVPVIMMYPFVQKYFIQGVMIGSIKG